MPDISFGIGTAVGFWGVTDARDCSASAESEGRGADNELRTKECEEVEPEEEGILTLESWMESVLSDFAYRFGMVEEEDALVAVGVCLLPEGL
jgi:hypothetical protein